ncbi:ImmA/IrrE family metallo-endopeptidase [Neobacillus sp. SM06]|uniref:ImmA/IrrE family metallo-endopeptidase n=1 Tax=Neobacillus sp. SM06 TaxID=3422492 RepID=UPI003D28251C
MSYCYNPFPLDSWVSRLYKEMGIYKPEDIDIRKIASKLDIHLLYSEKRSFANEEDNFKLINLNKFLDEIKQREIFFHELAHILRHEGYQYKLMAPAFRALQEWEANRFTRYAAIPYHMLHYVDWNSPSLVKDMSEMFKVSEDLCEYRVNQVYRNIKPKEVI